MTISAIVGDPKAPDGLESMDLCAHWRTEGNSSGIDFRLGPANDRNGCEDNNDPERPSVARVGTKYLEVACNSGGVFASICDGDYSVTLDTLGANAAGLRRYFRLGRPDEMELGCDDKLGTGDDPFIECAQARPAAARSAAVRAGGEHQRRPPQGVPCRSLVTAPPATPLTRSTRRSALTDSSSRRPTPRSR